MPRTYKVEVVDVKKKYASILVDAESEKEAIKKAKEMRWDDFDETEATTQNQWIAKTEWSFTKYLTSFFNGG
tara:strand:- start:291 stop:506 length:216 start_codon:yes stop_codon:yes gene_type:complete